LGGYPFVGRSAPLTAITVSLGKKEGGSEMGTESCGGMIGARAYRRIITGDLPALKPSQPPTQWLTEKITNRGLQKCKKKPLT
jgi:hypothetical protein